MNSYIYVNSLEHHDNQKRYYRDITMEKKLKEMLRNVSKITQLLSSQVKFENLGSVASKLVF